MRLRKNYKPRTTQSRRGRTAKKTGRQKPEGIRTRTVTRERTDVVMRIIFIMAFFSIAFFGINAHWPWLKHIDVRGAATYSNDEIISLAGLGDCEGLWAVALPLDTIAGSLQKNPFIEQAQISLTGLNSIRIKIIERRPVAAIEHNRFRFVFDRTGELLEILSPSENCPVPEVKYVPLGLLRFQGEPFYTFNPAWRLPENSRSPEIMERQFDRLIQLRFLLDRYTPDREEFLDTLSMDSIGKLTVEYQNCPPILLGDFDSPDIQMRRLVATLDDELVTDPARTRVIDLSSVLFPCYHVYDNYLTRAELRFIEDVQNQVDDLIDAVPLTALDNPAATEVSDGDTDAESVEGDTWEDTGDEEDVVVTGSSIFDLAGGR